MSAEKISHYNMTYSGCIPLSGLRRFDVGTANECERFNLQLSEFANLAKAKTVVLTSRFPLFLQGDRYNNGEGGVEPGDCVIVDLATRESSDCNDSERRSRVLQAYESRIRELAQSFNVVLVYPVPEAGWNVPDYAFKNAYFKGNKGPVTTSYDRYKERSRDVTVLFDRLDRELPNVYAARVDEVLCSEETGRCINADENGIYYYDDNHLSNAGARLVAPVIVDAIKAANASDTSLY